VHTHGTCRACSRYAFQLYFSSSIPNVATNVQSPSSSPLVHTCLKDFICLHVTGSISVNCYWALTPLCTVHDEIKDMNNSFYSI
jgi:hypothetical protein